MGSIRNVLDEGVGQQGGITKSGESGGVAGVPTAPANVQIVDKARRDSMVYCLKRRKTMFGKLNQGTPERSCGTRARPPQPRRACFGDER